MTDNKSTEPEDIQAEEILEEDVENVAGGSLANAGGAENCMLATVGTLI
jgi:hypothetical protein